jgi:hypothetical protein
LTAIFAGLAGTLQKLCTQPSKTGPTLTPLVIQGASNVFSVGELLQNVYIPPVFAISSLNYWLFPRITLFTIC